MNSKKTLNSANFRVHLSKFVDLIGNIKVAASLLGSTVKTLEMYLNGGVEIPKHKIEKLSQLVKPNKEQVFLALTHYVNELEKDSKEMRQDNSDLRYKLWSIEKENQKFSNCIEETGDPLLAYIQCDFFKHTFELLKNAVKKAELRKDYYEVYLYHAFKELGSLYELFRPPSIKNSDPYWGTVKTMEHLNHFIYRLTDLPIEDSFDKFFNSSWVNAIEIKKPLDISKINWDGVINDINIIEEAINKTRNQQAVNYFLRFGISSYPIDDYIKQYILDQNNTLEEDDIRFQDNNIFICSKKLNFNNTFQLDSLILKIDKNV